MTEQQQGQVKQNWMNRPRSKVVWHAKSIGGALAVVASILAIAAAFSFEWIQERIEWIALLGLHWALILHLARCILEYDCPTYFGNPRVKKVFRDDRLLIVERSPWLGVGVPTSVYIVEDQLERLVCVGEVVNVQLNDLVQIKVALTTEGMQCWKDIWSALEKQQMDSLIIRPGHHPGIFADDRLQ